MKSTAVIATFRASGGGRDRDGESCEGGRVEKGAQLQMWVIRDRFSLEETCNCFHHVGSKN